MGEVPVLLDTISIAVADFGLFSEGELFGGYMQVKFSKWHRSETHFCGKCWHCFGPENMLAPLGQNSLVCDGVWVPLPPRGPPVILIGSLVQKYPKTDMDLNN